MSRYSFDAGDGLTVEYGFDRVPRPGYFFSVERQVEKPEGTVNEIVEAGDTRSSMIVSPKEKHMNRSEIVDRLADLGAPEEHIEKMAMDLQF